MLYRPSSYQLFNLLLYSTNRKISLSFGERLLTSYPGINPLTYRGLITSNFHPSFRLFDTFFFYIYVFVDLDYSHPDLILYSDFSDSTTKLAYWYFQGLSWAPPHNLTWIRPFLLRQLSIAQAIRQCF